MNFKPGTFLLIMAAVLGSGCAMQSEDANLAMTDSGLKLVVPYHRD